MTDVVDISERRHAGPWKTGPVVCAECGWQYVAVRHQGTLALQCCAQCGEKRSLVSVEFTRHDAVIVYDRPGAEPREEPLEQ